MPTKQDHYPTKEATAVPYYATMLQTEDPLDFLLLALRDSTRDVSYVLLVLLLVPPFSEIHCHATPCSVSKCTNSARAPE